ncbi:MAG: flavodoxin family protein [Syntrophales bacterium]|jgi:flavodoxin|nr:flavodoxin family protein [Syntrophales bacterium]MDY0045000.1 flavodoxin family protein [Syntrophales bacterium]
MKVLIVYQSKTGNTEKVARSIYDALNVGKEILPVSEVKDVTGYDLVFCGFPVIAHSVPEKMSRFIKGLPEGQKVALFATHGSLRGGTLPKQAFESAAGLTLNLDVLGQFGCRGKVDSRVIEALLEKPEHRAWAEEAQGAQNNPDATDLADAADFAINMLGKAHG